jgi:hypothetical protein
MRPVRPLLMLVLVLLAACASGAGPAPEAAAPAVVPVPDLSGTWGFSVDVGGRMTTGELVLLRQGGDYTGTITPQGTNTLQVRSLRLTGQQVDLLVDTPEGPVTFAGTLGEDARSMQGIVTYHGGQRFPMAVEKREAAGEG